MDGTSSRHTRGGLHWWMAVLIGWSAARADVAVVRESRPVAIIVTPESPNPVIRYAAEELVYHLEKATGAKLEVATETSVASDSRPRIYLGDTHAARAAGIDAARLAPETFVLRTDERANAVFMAGNDSGGDP